MKRKNAPDVQQSPAKNLRRDGISEEDDDGRAWDLKAGMIMEVKLKNFMCHETFSYVPNQRINFLAGENGSGKSAVLTAIVFGLGGSARTSNRGTSNKGFIRTGQSSANVEIKLANVGENSYKPEVYGDSLTVCRGVTQSASTYKIKDHAGRVVVDKRVREELDRILMAFNIQVDNPIAVLNQDTAKTFLFKCEPDKLYTFFMRATQLEGCKNDYNAAALEKGQSEAFLEEKKNSLPELKRELEKWEKKYQFHMNLNTRRADIKTKKGELSWAVVRDQEFEVDEIKKKLDTEQRKLPMCDKSIEKHSDEEKSMRQRKKQVEAEIQNIASGQREEEEKLKELKRDYEKKHNLAKTSRKAVNQVKREQDKINADIEALSEKVEELRRTGTAEFEEKHKERIEKMKNCQMHVDTLDAQKETSTNHLKHLNANTSEIDQKLFQMKADLTKENGKVSKIQQDLKDLMNSGKNKLAAFSSYMPNLVSEISRNKRFKCPPIGPLGAYINVREDTPENIARAIEAELGGLMLSFLVSCSEDQRELYNLFERKIGRNNRKPTIFTCKFTDRKHDVSTDRASSSSFPVLIDFCQIDDANVYNRVVDSGCLERILYISSTDEAERVLSNPDLVPRNVLHANVANSYQYYPAPNYRSYFKEDRSRGLLKANIDEMIAQMENQIACEKQNIKRYEIAIKDVESERRENLKQVGSEDAKIKSIMNKIRDLNNKILYLKNEEENEAPPDISALEDDLEKRKEDLDKVVSQLQEENEKFVENTEIESAAREAYTLAEQENQDHREKVEPLSNELAELENGIKKAKRDKEHYLAKKEEYKTKIGDVEKAVEEKVKKLDELVENAKRWSEERISSRKKVDSLKREVFKMEESLKQQEETQEPRELVTQKYDSIRKIFERAKAQVQYVDKTVTFLKTMLEKRKSGFKQIRNTTGKFINRNFIVQLNERQYIGQLEFNHREKTLTITVNPDSKSSAAALDVKRDIRSLSGGEKSYSSVSLILALWNAMTPPFRVLDEFDVFMDALNRRISLENIINYASEDRKFQFIFLTPLNIDNINVSSDIKIIKLAKK